MEKDDEITGVTGSHYTTHFRGLDTRIGRWWSLDPEASKLPWQSPYVSMDNNPISLTDPLGNLIDGWENKNGDIVYIDDDVEGHGEGSTYTSKSGMTWTNIGKEAKDDWSDDKKIKFYNAHHKWATNELKDIYKQQAENNKTIKVVIPLFDAATDLHWGTSVPKTIYSLSTGRNPIEDYGDLGITDENMKYNSKEDGIDDALSWSGLSAEWFNLTLTLGKNDPVIQHAKFLKKVPYVGTVITVVSVSKTLYNGYFDGDTK